ncbi:restriction endonuclease [Candidatus Fermentibacteria bacterium]|nr:restriction endonuclease [Candidatus Fermentibacteria bacterium]
MKQTSSLYDIQLGLGLTVYEERAGYGTALESEAPTYPEVEDLGDLRQSDKLVRDLRRIDWAFTEDDTDFLTHDLHPYPAKFIPQIPGHLIARLSRRGELVLDPFGGSGTAALEAIRLGRRAVSVDANAVGSLIGKVKTCNITRDVATDLHGIRCVLTAQLQDLPSDPAHLMSKYKEYIPAIPNREKWFPDTSCGELGLIRSAVMQMTTEAARSIGLLALSRIILRASFQDSETRYSSRPKEIDPGETIKVYLQNLEEIIRNILKTQPTIRYGVAQFVTADTRTLGDDVIQSESVDLIVTSPPYGNAMDYHLYHRFRLLWLGNDPRALARIEIGSHLRHQRESSGFDAYMREMTDCLGVMFRVLRPGRYAALVVGDSIYENVLHHGATAFAERATDVGFQTVCIIEREIHRTKRSFLAAGRRATTENILVLRKPEHDLNLLLEAPPYKLWPYEEMLRTREARSILHKQPHANGRGLEIDLDSWAISDARRLVFTHRLWHTATLREPTWQAILENGFVSQPSARKDPKYVTHGIHAYKGKFYPQLAKALINLAETRPGAFVLDPFCGSGTTLLEGYLNGCRTAGCDMHPLAAKIARAKIGILDTNPDVLREAVVTILRKMEGAENRVPAGREQFAPESVGEIEKWFPGPVADKLNLVLKVIRTVTVGVMQDFFEVLLSSIIRDVSQQDPSDLRIRRRKTPIKDADVFGLFANALDAQYQRIERFWSVRGHAPNKFHGCSVVEGDSRNPKTFAQIGAGPGTVDLILTSPPYATALPYIDTDRLSLLVLMGLDASKRRPLEQGLVGSREIITSEKRHWEGRLMGPHEDSLPRGVRRELRALTARIADSNGGFRRKNMPALLTRFFSDMATILGNCERVLRDGGQAMIVIGDNRTSIDDEDVRIPTTDWVQETALHMGLKLVERIDISVTTENLVHIRNAITENVVLWLKKR